MKLIFKQSSKKHPKLVFFNPVKLNTKQSVRKIPLKNLTWSQASIRFPRMNPFEDVDKDGKLNIFDCRPFDKKRHSEMSRDEIANRLYIKDENSKGAYNRVKKLVKQEPKFEKRLRKYISGGKWREDWTDESIENVPEIDYRTHEGKSITEGIAKKYYKLVTPIDVIKHIEKHPQLLKSFNNVDLESMTPINRMRSTGVAVSATLKRKAKIYLASSTQKDEDVGEVLEHELSHIEQGKERIKKLHAQTKDWKNRRNMSNEEYGAMPVEKDAEERRINRRKEWESYKEEKPEILQSLNTGDVNIEPIEHKDED